MICELPEVQAGFRKSRGTRDQIAEHPLDHQKSKRVPEENIYFCFIDYAKAFDCVDHNKLWKILMPLEKSVCRSGATVRTGHGKMDWFQTWKGVSQGCVLSPCLFIVTPAEYIMRNAGLEEAQAGIKIARRNIHNIRYADDTTLITESEELKNLLMNVKKESEKVGLKLNSQKTKITASGPFTSWQIDGETVETVTNFILRSPKSPQMVTAALNLGNTSSLKEKL